MIDTLRIYEELKNEISPSAAKKIADAIGRVYTEVLNTVTKEEFKELREIVSELAEAQKRTEQRVEELAEAQKETQKEVSRLDKVLQELAEAQKKTEQRVNELAEAQKKTEEELRKLVGERRKTREHLGSLTHTVGYVLEDRAYRGLPDLLKRDLDIDLIAPLKRDYIEISPGRYEEVNIIGRARKNGKEFQIIGECKSQLKKTDIDNFLKLVERLKGHLRGERILLAVTYQTPPQVREYAMKKGIRVYFSYEMPL